MSNSPHWWPQLVARAARWLPIPSLEYVVSAADSHSWPTSVGRRKSPHLALIADIVGLAHDSGASAEVIIATAWDCPFDGPTDPSRAC